MSDGLERREPGRTRGLGSAPGRWVRLTFALMALLGLGVPLALLPGEQGSVAVWAWDVAGGWGLPFPALLFVFGPAAVGLLALVNERRPRAQRGVVLVVSILGLVLLMLSGAGLEYVLFRSGSASLPSAVSTLLQALLAGGLLAALHEPRAPNGHVAAGATAALGLLLWLLPIWPGRGDVGEATGLTGFESLLRSLRDETYGGLVSPSWPLRATLFVGPLLDLLAKGVALLLLLPALRRRGRAKVALLLLLASVGAHLGGAFALLLELPAELRVQLSVMLMPLVSTLGLRVLPVLALLAFGLADLIAPRAHAVHIPVEVFAEGPRPG